MYPTPGAYQEALQFPEAAFVDDDLREAEPETNALGLPKAVTGAFAAVFSVSTRTQRWAVKCFLTAVPDRKTRYAAIARHLAQTGLSGTVAFDYRPRGIRVNGEVYPVLAMAWAEGIPLNRFVAEHLHAPETLEALAEAWAALLAELGAAGIAHGDLQHGNVLVAGEDASLRLTLIDYDTMFVPALKGRRSAEVGHRNYQHPDRNEHDFGPTLDRFSGLVVYAALQALRHRPALFDRFDTGENLLFRAADFYDPAVSPLFEALDEIEPLASLVRAVRDACYMEPEAVPTLAEVQAEATGTTASKRLRKARRRRPGTGEGRRPGMPHTPFEQAFLPALVAWLGAVGIVLRWGGVVPGLALLVGGLLAGGWLATVPYRRLPLVRRRRRLRREIAYFDRLLRDLQRQIETLRAEREAVLASVEQMRTERLRELQEEVLEDHLKYHFTSDAGQFEGITHRMVVRLKRAGLRNAYHVTPERLQAIHELGDEGRVRILLWRNALAARYAEAIPQVLSPAEERRFERYVAHRLDGVSNEIQRAKAKSEVQQGERAQVLERAASLPSLSFGRYLLFLLRMGTIPPVAPAPARPAVTPPPGDRRLPAPVHRAEPDEASWWQQTS